MNVKYKYVLLFTTCLWMGLTAKAQDQNPKNKESEIVMTKAELESFLTNIADKKRAQIEKRKKELAMNQEFKNAFEPKEKPDDSRLYREFDRINQRIDLLMMNAGNRMNNYGTAPVSSYPQAPAVFYQQQQPLQPQQQPQIVYSSTPPQIQATAEPASPSEETLSLQRTVNSLNEEVRVLTLLSQQKKDGEYDDEISALRSKLDEMNRELQLKNQSIHESSVVYIQKNDSLKKGLANYKHMIYYANNSTTISYADKTTLEEVVSIVKQYDPRVTIVVQGFASKLGSARHNSELSFNRAEAVKQFLLSRGLNAKNIITMYHGVDNGG
ncbi:MAG: OmpA family protein, partial [Chitinophagaceae bacterium]|nr:OmpA family protein [Chitinophagaceae bacterium]